MEQNNIIVEEINAMIEATKAGKVNWIAPTPNTDTSLQWTRSVEGTTYTVNIQKQNSSSKGPVVIQGRLIAQPGKEFYSLIIIKKVPSPNQVLLQINSQTEPQYLAVLTELYNQALVKVKESTAKILGNLLKGL